MNDILRNWITSSLLSGYKTGQLQNALLKAGFPPEEVESELGSAAPYITVICHLQKKLKAREALLKTLDYQMRALPSYLKPERVKLPLLEKFLGTYYFPNRVGLFSDVLDNCEAKNWTPRNLVDKVGADTIVEIQSDREKAGDRYAKNSLDYRKHIIFGDFIERMENTGSSDDFYITGANYAFNSKALEALKKDIAVGDGYLLPENQDRKMYFLIGPKGTVTATHYDFINNFFIQIYGRKLFRLIPALQVPYLYNNSPTFSDVDLLHHKPSLHPDFSKATIIEIEVGPGDGLFIPIGWWHHVTSLSPSISIACANLNIPGQYENKFIDLPKIL